MTESDIRIFLNCKCFSEISSHFVIQELRESILWDKMKTLSCTPLISTICSEWNAWKHEAMKCFSTSHSFPRCGDQGQEKIDESLNQISEVSRKRPKLEIRRADLNFPHIDTKASNASRTVENNSRYFSSQEAVATLASEPLEGDSTLGATLVDLSETIADKRDELLVQKENPDVQINSPLIPVSRPVTTQTKSRHCIAFVKSKGRQCARWANEGDDYCCVHLASGFVKNSPGEAGTPSVSAQMCEGTTVHGNKCKHRSLPGSSFCKKHQPRADAKQKSNFPGNFRKRNHEEGIPISDVSGCQGRVLFRDVDRPIPVDPVSVMGADISRRNVSVVDLEHSVRSLHISETLKCIGSFPGNLCTELAKKYSLYCEEHLPKWLKDARDGKNGLVSKEVFLDLLKDCQSPEKKLHLHQTCELFYKLLKSLLSLRKPVLNEAQFQWAVTEAQKKLSDVELFTLSLIHI